MSPVKYDKARSNKHYEDSYITNDYDVYTESPTRRRQQFMTPEPKRHQDRIQAVDNYSQRQENPYYRKNRGPPVHHSPMQLTESLPVIAKSGSEEQHIVSQIKQQAKLLENIVEKVQVSRARNTRNELEAHSNPRSHPNLKDSQSKQKERNELLHNLKTVGANEGLSQLTYAMRQNS